MVQSGGPKNSCFFFFSQFSAFLPSNFDFSSTSAVMIFTGGQFLQLIISCGILCNRMIVFANFSPRKQLNSELLLLAVLTSNQLRILLN